MHEHVRQRTCGRCCADLHFNNKPLRTASGDNMTNALLRIAIAAAIGLAGTLPSFAQTAEKKEPTPAQLQARERQKLCGAEWQTAKAAKTLPANATWPKFWSACNTRLKAKDAEKRA